ncbi:trichome birefringence-like protein 3 [Tanacetum coccineum]
MADKQYTNYSYKVMTLNKDEVTRVPVWVKIHKVPVVAYTADGLSIIATQIGNPLSLDAFTSKMCVETLGRIGYARALIEVSADKELKQEVIMAIPKGENASDGHTMAKIPVEYEWNPPLYSDCHVFGHLLEQCPKKISVKPIKPVVVSEDGFTTVVNRKNKGKVHTTNQKNNVGGFKVNNSKNFQYQPVKPKVADPTSSTSGTKAVNKEKIQEGESNGIKLRNLFEKLNDITYVVDPNSDIGESTNMNDPTKQHYENSDSQIEEVYAEENPKKPKGASTPINETPHV